MRESSYYGSRSNPGMGNKNHKGKTPRHDVNPHTKSAGGHGTPHPNGGNVRPCPVDGVGKMPARMKGAQVTHTKLRVPNGNDRMPPRMTGGRNLEPNIR